jgi:hypothetical protein
MSPFKPRVMYLALRTYAYGDAGILLILTKYGRGRPRLGSALLKESTRAIFGKHPLHSLCDSLIHEL